MTKNDRKLSLFTSPPLQLVYYIYSRIQSFEEWHADLEEDEEEEEFILLSSISHT